MVNAALTGREDAPERRLALAQAPSAARAGLAALFALDDRLAAILRTTREPLVGQMRLTWWYEALAALDEGPPPAEPVLAALAACVLPRGVSGMSLAAMIDGWEALLDDAALGADAMTAFAAARGGGLFAAAARVLDADPAVVARAGGAWALADLSANLSEPGARDRARALAEDRSAGAFRPRLPRAARPLGSMALAAMLDLRGTTGARRASRLARHLLTGG